MSRFLINNIIENIIKKYRYYHINSVFIEIKTISFDTNGIFDTKFNEDIMRYNLLNWLLECLKVDLEDENRIKQTQLYCNIISNIFHNNLFIQYTVIYLLLNKFLNNQVYGSIIYI